MDYQFRELFVYLAILFIPYIIADILLRKKTGVKMRWVQNNFKDRNRFFLTVDVIVMVFSLLATVNLTIKYPGTPPFMIIIFFLVSSLLQGLEQWLYKREKQEHLHTWLASGVIFASLVAMGVVFL
ncbi:hypothetical protein GCM10008967_36020 [Bacillus carboniphilus]|uniref:DUF4181 domain-containing protein n=1 Tax=Bacillus carboniphilus TaxID=86663 RepID=A0ABP3GCW7_9BACI